MSNLTGSCPDNKCRCELEKLAEEKTAEFRKIEKPTIAQEAK